MRGEIVAIDLETTGLDPKTDKIIEIGAVRMKNGTVLDEFSVLVDPELPLPPLVSQITGIQAENLRGKPTIDSILPLIAEFVGSRPVIAHNISFDMGFLQNRYRILIQNPTVDTYDLAAIMLPDAPRYNLNSLTQQLNIELEQAHRALDDARATALLYWQLWEKITQLPGGLLNEIVRANRNLNWPTGIVFEAALQGNPPAKSSTISNQFSKTLTAQHLQNSSNKTNSIEIPPELTQLEQVLGPTGILAEKLPEFEYRPQQIEIASNITEAFKSSAHLIIEAGTGAGKTMGYLIPALLWAIEKKTKVVISTQTLTLQEQLANRDLPLLAETLGLNLTFATLKGRSHYISPQQLEVMKRRGPATLDELRTYAKIIVWMLENQSGERSDLNLRGREENSVWDQLSAEYAVDEHNSPYQTARQRAEAAQIVIINHALLASDAVAENHVIPDYDYLIVDEAHHLEHAITQSFQQQIGLSTIQAHLAQLGSADRGLLVEIKKLFTNQILAKKARRVNQFIDDIVTVKKAMEVHSHRLFETIGKLIEGDGQGRSGEFNSLVRISLLIRETAQFAEVQHNWQTLKQFMIVLEEATQKISQALLRVDLPNSSLVSEYSIHASQIAHRLATLRESLETIIDRPHDNEIYWLRSIPGEKLPTLCAAPLHVGKLIEKHIWSAKQSVILLSATLRTSDGFKFVQKRLNADHIRTIEVGSPFNYQSSALVYMPTDIPEPSDRTGYQQAIERAILEMAAALHGKVMVLFTSYSQLRQTAQNVTSRLALGGITVFDQSDGTSRGNLLDGFRSTDKAVLLGTRSFWEGVDIPGDDLSCLIITRLPFTVPSDPIFAARSETYANSFNQYALPEAILRFRQGFGRLIRRKSDKGIVVILDKRITSKGYGGQFLDALPGCTMQKGLLKDVGQVALDWLNPETNQDEG